MARHVVIAGPLEHDGKAYQDGDEVDLPAAAAEILLESGIVKAKPAAKKPTAPAKKD